MARFEMPADRLWYVPTPARVDTVEGMFDGSLFRYPETADVVILCCYSDHYYDLPTIPGSIKEINIAAMSMSVMNMWLAATALGVGAGWDSFPVIGEGVLRTSPSRVPRLVLCGGRFFRGFRRRAACRSERPPRGAWVCSAGAPWRRPWGCSLPASL